MPSRATLTINSACPLITSPVFPGKSGTKAAEQVALRIT